MLGYNLAVAKTDVYSSTTIVNGVGWNSNQTLIANIPYASTNTFGQINFKTKILFSYVRLSLNTEAIPSNLNAFSANVPITITYYIEGMPNVIVTKILEVDYDPVLGAKYKNVAVEQMENAYKIEIQYNANTLNLGTGSITTVHKGFISMQAFTEHERYYNYYGIFGPIINLNAVTANITNSYDSTNNEVTINWAPIDMVEGYELEYTFVDDYGKTNLANFIPANQLQFSFKNNSTRILLKDNKYTMPLVQEHGYLVYRVRGYGIGGTNLDRIFYGAHYATVSGDQTFTVANYPNMYKFQIANNVHTNDKINWQSVTSFAEEGKSKTVVKYMDGTMRSRQTVTSTSTEKNAIIAETIYDFKGRPAVNILPTPVDHAAIKYYPNFNQNLNGQPFSYNDFDKKGEGECDPFNINPLKQQNNSGAGNYYSQYNPNKTDFNAYIPEAKGYPFTRVTYMPDPTDRVVRQGGVGELFQPGKTTNNLDQNHDTKYFYGKPEQEKLDLLFGTNAGFAEFYQKNMMVDANGQVSISYVDLDGKTIATALAGVSPTSLEQLESFQSNHISINLLSSSDIVDANKHSITNSQTFLVSSNQSVYNFKYTLKENTFNALTCTNKNYCLDCVYDLKITLVKDQCAKVEYTKIMTVGNLDTLNFVCNDANASVAFDFSSILDVGSYTITKELIVNQQAATTYANKILNDPTNSCLKSYDDFYNEAWQNRDTTRCMNSCDACMAESNNAGSPSAIASAVNDCDTNWCKPQIASLCDLARTSMINDLTPSGQYAGYLNDNGSVNLGVSPISIFNNSASGGIKTLYNTTAIQNISITLPGENPYPLSHYLSTSALVLQLINNWPDDLSEKLLPLHPEYCYLKFCDLTQIQNSDVFDTQFMSADTFAQAQTAGIVNNINSFYNQDPLYSYMNLALKTDMANRFNNYAGAGNSIVKLAVFAVNCPAGNNLNTCPGAWADNSNDDDEWDHFKSFYYSIKQEFIQKAREYYVQNTAGCCPNKFIGCLATNSDGFLIKNCNVSIFNTNNGNNQISSCFNPILNNLYGHAISRFSTINDIPFPNLPATTSSIYDMTPQQLADYTQSNTGNNNAVCPSCPELDAFKVMMFYIQNKGWLQNGATVKADEIAGLKDALRNRFLGSLNNENVTIANASPNSFAISSTNCKLTFSCATSIKGENTTIIPTCLEIIDFKNAKLHILLNGVKAELSITSTCDFFYCEGEKPTPPVVDNSCHCDEEYSKTKTYHLGQIVKFKGVCYLAKKASQKDSINAGNSPDSKGFWDKLCKDEDLKCVNPFEITFDTPIPYTSGLTIGNLPLQSNKYVVQNNYSGATNVSFSSNVFIARTQGSNQLIIQKNAPVVANKTYKLTFDYNLIDTPRDLVINIKINNQLVGTIQNSVLSGWQNYSFEWNSSKNTSVDIKISNGNRESNVIAIDNLKMICSNQEISPKSKPSKSNSKETAQKAKYIPANVCGCSTLCDPPEPSPEMPFISCEDIQKGIATQQANEAYETYRDSIFNNILSGYYEKCMKSIEKFDMDYNDSEYHYTLYYYDQSGNLVQTIPPAGIQSLASAQLANVTAARVANNNIQVLPSHLMATTYGYNSLNAVVRQKTPDAGISEFFYDKLGRIVLSQNAKQNPLNEASYTYYDMQGRNIEVGQIDVVGVPLKPSAFNNSNWINFINSRNRTEITHSYYDKAIKAKINDAFGVPGQKNLRNRIATVAVFDKSSDLITFETDGNLATTQYSFATHYNYDIQGNVTDLYQDFGKNSPFGFDPQNIKNQSKHIGYTFDLISKKVNEVQYQKGFEDQFIYRYKYNADNKLTEVYTSTNGIIWENDARYKYYRHGPLARAEIGTDKVQGIDYAYTLQGWMKGVNGFTNNTQTDIGKDGIQTNTTASDVYSYWLSFYKDDYQAIGNNLPAIANTIQPLTTGVFHTDPSELFNGNIRSMYTNIQPFGGLGMQYKYDQLNRIKKQKGYSFNGATNTPINSDGYAMQLTYDGNGNIQTLLRNGTINTPGMDNLTYTYYNDNGTTYTGNPNTANATNRLASVSDTVANANYPEDIDTQQPLNFTYDKIGNLTTDVKEGITTIEWNIQNKINKITKANNATIEYSYDTQGNRISKVAQGFTNQPTPKIEYYVRDAQGNPLAIYTKASESTFEKEQQIYGSARLGVHKQEVKILANNFPINQMPDGDYAINSYRNQTLYELTNHLGNVLATITDSKTYTNSNLNASLVAATDYYAFGAPMPDRSFTSASGYRFGFNGKENDNEVKGEGNQQDYGFRVYDPRLGKFLSVDPLTKKYPELTPYQFASNTPIQAIDLGGAEKEVKTQQPVPDLPYHSVSTAGDVAYNINAFLYNGIIAQPVSLLYEASEGTINDIAWGVSMMVSPFPPSLVKDPIRVQFSGRPTDDNFAGFSFAKNLSNKEIENIDQKVIINLGMTFIMPESRLGKMLEIKTASPYVNGLANTIKDNKFNTAAQDAFVGNEPKNSPAITKIQTNTTKIQTGSHPIPGIDDVVPSKKTESRKSTDQSVPTN